MPFRLWSILLALAFALIASPALSQEGGSPGPVLVVDVQGPLDQRLLDFVVETIEGRDAQVVVLQVDSPDISSGEPGELFAVMEETAIPVVAWVGPAGAVAYGDVTGILARTDRLGAAPGAHWGLVTGHPDPALLARATAAGIDAEELKGDLVVTEDGDPSLVTDVSPSIGQFIAGLHGAMIEKAGRVVTLDTAMTVTNESGVEVVVPSVEVRFLKPGLFTRFLRLASRPEAALFFLLAGISAAAFEFYAAGVGVTAAVAALSLFVSAYGIATLPVNWWALGLVLVGMLLYTAAFQQNKLGIAAGLGTVMLLWGGFAFTDSAPQYPPRIWLVVLIVAGTGTFYALALPTVVRARFSTRTIGREYLVGRRGVAETDFGPEGIVSVNGARWRARSHRAAGIRPGDLVEVTEVRGIVLEVGPYGGDPESVDVDLPERAE